VKTIVEGARHVHRISLTAYKCSMVGRSMN
jgi:hypothetical protein